jgi:hypothetical protein
MITQKKWDGLHKNYQDRLEQANHKIKDLKDQLYTAEQKIKQLGILKAQALSIARETYNDEVVQAISDRTETGYQVMELLKNIYQVSARDVGIIANAYGFGQGTGSFLDKYGITKIEHDTCLLIKGEHHLQYLDGWKPGNPLSSLHYLSEREK